MKRFLGFLAIWMLPAFPTGNAHGQPDADLVESLRQLDARVIVLGKVREQPLGPMLSRAARADLQAANQREIKAWAKVQTKADWEAFRDARLQSLRASLGSFPPAAPAMKFVVTRKLQGDGFQIDNVMYVSRPGVAVTANLYSPDKPAPAMPAIIIVHSHHRPKHVGQRQDMAMTWARAGCLVLVPDLLGHGERRLHPFGDASAYDKPFNAAQQDYYFRYDLGMQLHLIGDSLMGWMAYDLSRGVDLLLAQPGIDRRRIILVSEPAGGGDVAAVTMTLDGRIAGGVITCFGGPQPESPYPLPRHAEQNFEFAGSGSWESTRNLRLSARDGFAHWLIVAAPAPRRLIYNHEFYWDRDNDPVWRRLQKVHVFYADAAKGGTDETLTGSAGWGFVVGSEPENTHWLPVNRELLYPTFERWFAIPNPKKEYSQRRPEHELLCLTPEVHKELKVQPFHEVILKLGRERAESAHKKLAALSLEERRVQLRKDWTLLLGDVAPAADPRLMVPAKASTLLGNIRVERIHLSVEPGIVVPLVILMPPHAKGSRLPVVMGVAQAGKQAFFKQRPELIAALLQEGVAVALADVRGTGETSPGDARDRRSPATALSATRLMLGETMLGGRLRDLRSVLRRTFRQRPELDSKRIALWGDSFTEPHLPDRKLQIPHGVDQRPESSEPLGGLLALLGGLFEDDIQAVYARGGLSDCASLLRGPFCYAPHDVVVPGVLAAGDLSAVAAALAPRAVRLEGLVDGLNRFVSIEELEQAYAPVHTAYRDARAPERFELGNKAGSSADIARWLATQLRGK